MSNIGSTRNNKVQTFLWFKDNNASQAAAFYASVLPGCEILSQNGMSVTIAFGPQQVILFNGGPHHALTPAVSLFVTCADQTEIDSLWEKLATEGGEEIRCGWCKDKFGLCWQVVPEGLDKLLSGSKKAMEAMMGMKKLEIALLRKAAAEDGIAVED